MKTLEKITVLLLCVCLLLTVRGGEAAISAGDMAVGTWTTNPRYITFGSWNGYDLVWRVLDVSTNDADNPDNKTALLLLDDVLRNELGAAELRYFHSTGDNDWNGSDIKAFLNSQFLDAFTADQQADIVTSNYTYGGAYADNDKTGSSKIFLLSVDEVTNPQYFSDGDNTGANADRALSGAAWWLRSPDNTYLAAFVIYSGAVDSIGIDLYNTLAVRPALKINLSSSDRVIQDVVWLMAK